MKLHIRVVSPERVLLEMDAESLSVPTPEGQITILPNHIPIVSIIKPGELIAKNERLEEYISVSGGFLEIKPHSEVAILADAAERYFEIDIERAEKAKQRAMEALQSTRLSEQEYASTLASLERSLSRINIARKRSHRRKSAVTGEGVLED